VSGSAECAPTQAVLLAAGRGSRTGALCAERPKALLPLAGRSLLDHNLDALRAAGIRRLCIVGGWQIDALRAWREQHAPPDLEIEIIEQPRWAHAGPVGSLRCAQAWLLRAPTLVLYGDCVYAPQTLRTATAGFAGGLRVPGDRRWAALWRQRFAQPLSDAERWRSANGRLLSVGGRAESLEAEGAQFMGLCLFDAETWTSALDVWRVALPEEGALDRLDFTGLFTRLLDAGQRIDCIELDGGWLEVDSAEDLALYEAHLAKAGVMHGWVA
jgi:choline kinase